ncbi:MAG TPA: DinB family protein [Gemmatimonadaceae bacterium]|jgi:uncharacterized damage-inducible protein DinB|nr:DinB family protein [Gemmatimonadaceae bacterium]
MHEHTRIAEQIRRASHGPAWHGPSLAEVLDDITTDEAIARPVPDAHSIWELVGHLTTWTHAVARRLEDAGFDPSEPENFPRVRDASPRAWAAACDRVLDAHEELAAAVERGAGGDLDAEVPGRGYPLHVMLSGAAEHTAYHTGQIAVLKRALGTGAK